MPFTHRSRTVNPRLGTYFGIFMSAFAALALVSLIFEGLGAPDVALRSAMFAGPILLYAAIGLAAFTREPLDYFAAGRRVPAFYSGLVLAQTAMGATGVLALTGGILAVALGLGRTGSGGGDDGAFVATLVPVHTNGYTIVVPDVGDVLAHHGIGRHLGDGRLTITVRSAGTTELIAVGEETGRLAELGLRVAESYERELRRSLRTLVGVVEPALILLFGVVVGFVALAMLQAIYGVSASVL